LLLFQKIESKGVTVVCNIKQGEIDSNMQALTAEDSKNTPLLLTDALETIDESDCNLRVSDVIAPKENLGSSWKMSFSLLGLPRPHAISNPECQKQSLVVKSVNDEQDGASYWSLKLIDDENKANAFPSENGLELTKPETEKNPEGSLMIVVEGNNQSADLLKSMQALTGQKNTAVFFEQDLNVKDVLASDAGYQKALKTLELCAPIDEWEKNREQEDMEFNDLLASLQC